MAHPTIGTPATEPRRLGPGAKSLVFVGAVIVGSSILGLAFGLVPIFAPTLIAGLIVIALVLGHAFGERGDAPPQPRPGLSRGAIAALIVLAGVIIGAGVCGAIAAGIFSSIE